jgi:hypothetical protein
MTPSLGVNLQTLVTQTTQVSPNVSVEIGAEWIRAFPYVEGSFYPRWANLIPSQWRSIRDLYKDRPTIACITHLSVAGVYGQNWSRNNWNEYVKKIISDPLNHGIHVWEIMNESHSPNQKSGFLQNGDPTSDIRGGAQAYSLMVQDAYKIIKGYDENNIVLAFGGLPSYLGSAIWQFNSNNWTAPSFMQFARDAWNGGMKDSCDGISVHCYSEFNFLLDEYPTYWSQVNQRYVTSNKTIRQIWGSVIKTYYEMCGRKPVWITETGFPANNPMSDHRPPTENSPDKQARFLLECFEYLSTLSFVQHINWWDLIDNPNPTGAGNLYWGWGILDGQTFAKKPVADAFTKFSNSR